MKRNLLFIAAMGLVLMACTSKKELKHYPFYLGTYTDGASEGIYHGILKSDGSFDTLKLAAKAENPSFLCFANKQKTLVAVNELDVEGTGAVESYAVRMDGLEKLSTSESGGAHPCHVSGNDKGDILVANYSGGNIGYLTIEQSGKLSPLKAVAQHYGKGVTERQASPHAHSIWFIDNEHAVAVDLGIDQLIFYQLIQGELLKSDSLKLDNGAGPRHLAIHPQKEQMYVINELNSTITVVGKVSGSWQVLGSISTLPTDFTGDSYCADIHISGDGRFIYASNRGHNSLAIFKIVGQQLELIGHESVRGDWPRNFALTPDGELLVVANQRSNNLVAFKRNRETGLLSYVSEQKAEMPVCVLFE
ncbi:lactonase family protein [Carboxylicivirga mesophila]|uniref:Lactonase family protein n=1 Tax=Carboxylicivirga mesophila TaxID=1166478 RepID=A0ABS5K8H2_9BACT|nr:lactonase family protein [Carboxylicivirga mesophila]MBS2211256.1 lactonase family protein [Carboxylicivirga mesophila]